jgi:hypothetical protein
MPTYSFTIRRGDHVIHSVADVYLNDPADAWGVIEELATQFETPGLRVIVKDEDGSVVIMAGLLSAGPLEQLTAA